MKRLLIFTALLLITTAGYSQQPALTANGENSFNYFGQCMLNLSSEDEYIKLEESLKANPNIWVVRLDRISQRSFIVSKQISSLSKEEFKSWFGEFSDRISCIQVGVHQLDEIDPYPFKNCKD